MKPILTGLFMTDTHVKGINPRGRLDDYPTTILRKIEWVVNTAIERRVDVVLHGGDWFDTFEVSDKVKASLIAVLRRLDHAGIPLLGVHGSHDVHGYAASTLPRTSLGVLRAAGVVSLLGYGDIVEVPPGVTIGGIPHIPGLDDPEHPDASYELPRRCQILLAHGTLVESPLPDGFSHTLLSDVQVNADLVLSGDYHPGYPVYQRSDGVTFYNPGSLARVKGTPNNRSRRPGVAYFELFTGNTAPRVDFLPVPADIARPGDEIFSEGTSAEPPPDTDIAQLVRALKEQTDTNTVRFDPLVMLENLPLDSLTDDPGLAAEAKALAAREIQAAMERR